MLSARLDWILTVNCFTAGGIVNMPNFSDDSESTLPRMACMTARIAVNFVQSSSRQLANAVCNLIEIKIKLS